MLQKFYRGDRGRRRRGFPAFRLLCGAAIALAVSGCCCGGGGGSKRPETPAVRSDQVSVYVMPAPPTIRVVAVMPFQAATELIGTSVSDLLVTEILRSGRCELVERTQLSKVLQEAEVSLAGLTDTKAVELGKMLGAQGVIVGSVDEYGMVSRKGYTYASVGISARLIDTNTGSVVWSVSHASTATSPEVSLSQHARAVISGMMAALTARWQTPRPGVPRGGRSG